MVTKKQPKKIFVPVTMYKILSTFEPGKQYTIKQIHELLTDVKYVDWNIRHYHSNYLLSRVKGMTLYDISNKQISNSNQYLYTITSKGHKKIEYLKKKWKKKITGSLEVVD